jgi:hypothetical protein
VSGSQIGVAIAVGAGFVVVVAAAAIPLNVSRRRKRRSASEGVPSPGGPPAGWYPDPSDPTQSRYWSGDQWGPSNGETPAGQSVVVSDGADVTTTTDGSSSVAVLEALAEN